ncbi:MAG: class I SAM-dependent methyltransferase [Corynebacterium sp.]|nr:class I SAM-dependent methyltransferase [Corynebacterium sp.]
MQAIDSQMWPSIAVAPTAPFLARRAKKAEADLAQACLQAGIELGGDSPELVVHRDTLFARIANAGWLGIAEGYMAGEWEAADLPGVLAKLLATDYNPKTPNGGEPSRYDGREVPPDLIALHAGDAMSAHGTLFSAGVPTKERVSVKSFVHGAGKANEPATHFVDVTSLSMASEVEKADLADGQLRALSTLFDASNVGTGSHILEFPVSSAAPALAAVARKATVDVYSADIEVLRDVSALLGQHSEAADVRTAEFDLTHPQVRGVQGNFDAIISLEKLESMDPKTQMQYVRQLDNLLNPTGYVGLQTVVATEKFGAAANNSLSVLRAYIWPGLNMRTSEQLHQVFDRNSSLRIIGELHFGAHYVEGLRLQREMFEGKLREAAAAGFDAVYRRLWFYQLSLREALFRINALDAVQATITRRARRGKQLHR